MRKALLVALFAILPMAAQARAQEKCSISLTPNTVVNGTVTLTTGVVTMLVTGLHTNTDFYQISPAFGNLDFHFYATDANGNLNGTILYSTPVASTIFIVYHRNTHNGTLTELCSLPISVVAP